MRPNNSVFLLIFKMKILIIIQLISELLLTAFGAAQFSEGQISGGSYTGGDSPGSKLPGGNFIGVILLGEFSRMGFSLYSEYNTMRLTLLQA